MSAGNNRTSQNSSLLDLVNTKAPELLQRPKSANNKFGPASPSKDGVKLGPPSVPNHVLKEKQVLRFYGQFSETRPWDAEGPLGLPNIEAEIVRNLVITYYLEDDTIAMIEGGASNGKK